MTLTLSKEFDDFRKKFIKNIDSSFSGLLFGEIIIFCISCLILWFIGKTFELNFEFKLLIIFIFVVSYFSYWYYKRKLPKFSEDENGILFAFNEIDKKVKEELDILHKKVITNIESENIESKIKVRILPEHISVLNFARSKEVREKSRAKIIVWGDVESGTIDSQKKELIINPAIRFTYETRMKKEKLQMFNQNISNIISKKSWMIDENEQKIERDYLSRNIEKISLYLIGWTLILSNSKDNRNDGVMILQRILKNNKKRNNLNNDEKLMVLNLEAQVALYYIKKIYNMNFRFTDRHDKEKIQRGRKLLNDMVDSGIGEVRYLLFECILDFLENKPKEILIEKLKKEVEFTNGNDAPVFYSLAFVEYYNGDIRKGFKYLKKAIKLIQPVDQMSSIVGWYEEALFENSNKKYLNFPIGQIYYNLLESADPERKIARESLNQFVLVYKDDRNEIILEMIDEAERMLKKISAKTNS